MNAISQDRAEVIYREHSAYVYRLALFLSKSSTLAEDITQETFLQVFRKYQSYDSSRPIAPWLYKITLNITRNTLRKQRWLQFIKEIPDDKGSNYLEAEVFKNQMGEEIWKEINALTPKCKEIIFMHYYLGWKLNEIAEILNIPLGTCKSRLNAALSTLERRLSKNSFLVSYKGEDIYETL